MGQKLKLVKNKAGRMVPTIFNGVKSVPFKGVGKHTPNGVKAAPTIRACQDFPSSGNKLYQLIVYISFYENCICKYYKYNFLINIYLIVIHLLKITYHI